MNKIVSLAKRRGFIFPSSEIYGGFSSCYDYGPLGVELKNNIKREWWKRMVWARPDIVGFDAAILMSPRVWEASGHLSAGFADELVECKSCHKRFRQDEILNPRPEIRNQKQIRIPKSQIQKCPECGGELTHPKKFNLMMKTFAGPVEDEAAVTYLRAETAQGIYVNFHSVLESMRMKLPFGIAQIGKAFRNEITPGNFTFRTREFEQMEMQFFVRPEAHQKTRKNTNTNTNQHEWGPKEWFEYWQKERMRWYVDLGIKKEHLQFKPHKKTELAHYAKAAGDIQYRYPFGLGELEGVHDRGTWDLSSHAKASGRDLSYFDEGLKEKYIPNIIETSAGADRSALVFLLNAYSEDEVAGEKRIVLRFHPRIAPVKVAILPLVKNKPELTKEAQRIFRTLLPHLTVLYDEVGSIGRRYRRQDEIGTPWAVTIDFDTIKDYTVTLRDRDTTTQKRFKIDDLVGTLKDKLEGGHVGL